MSDELALGHEQESWAEFEDEVEAKGFTQISNVLLKDPNISMQAKTMYALLKSYAWQDPHCFPGQKRLSDDTGLHRSTIGKLTRELHDAGYIKVIRRGLTRRTCIASFACARMSRLCDILMSRVYNNQMSRV